MMPYPCRSSPASESRMCSVAGESGRNSLRSSAIDLRYIGIRVISQVGWRGATPYSDGGLDRFGRSLLSSGFQCPHTHESDLGPPVIAIEQDGGANRGLLPRKNESASR